MPEVRFMQAVFSRSHTTGQTGEAPLLRGAHVTEDQRRTGARSERTREADVGKP